MIIAGPSNARKIPTFLGLVGVLMLVVVVAITVRGANQITRIFSQAASPVVPSDVGVANVTDTGATVYWVTDKSTAGSVFYGKTPSLGDGVVVDDRDLSSQNNLYPAHFVRISGLRPTTKYYFKIGVGQDTFGDPAKSGQPYEVTTGTTLPAAPVVDPIFGKVLDQTGAALSGGIIIWDTSGSSKIAALSKGDGNYVLPLGNARTAGLDNYQSVTDGLSETIILNGGGGSLQATITCKVGQDRPLPTVKLGETIDCSQKANSGAAANGSFAPPKTPGVASPSAGIVTLDVVNGQSFPTPLPTFSGKTGPNQVVQVLVRSETPYSGTVQADPSGSWSWTPPASLAPGQHTVTITVVNPDGTTQTITRTFTVESGTSILPITSGTPSATLTHLTCVGNTCSTVSGAGPNTCATDGDCVVTPPPAPVVPPPVPPKTGSTENTVILLTLGLISATLGGVMVLRQNGLWE